MGTRSMTRVLEESGSPVVNIYRHYDGYPDGHGVELAAFLESLTLVNGLPMGFEERDDLANGMDCLAAQVVKHLKVRAGGVYLMPMDHGDEEYNYEVYERGGAVRLRMSGDDERFDGTPAEFLAKYREREEASA